MAAQDTSRCLDVLFRSADQPVILPVREVSAYMARSFCSWLTMPHLPWFPGCQARFAPFGGATDRREMCGSPRFCAYIPLEFHAAVSPTCKTSFTEVDYRFCSGWLRAWSPPSSSDPESHQTASVVCRTLRHIGSRIDKTTTSTHAVAGDKSSTACPQRRNGNSSLLSYYSRVATPGDACLV